MVIARQHRTYRGLWDGHDACVGDDDVGVGWGAARGDWWRRRDLSRRCGSLVACGGLCWCGVGHRWRRSAIGGRGRRRCVGGSAFAGRSAPGHSVGARAGAGAANRDDAAAGVACDTLSESLIVAAAAVGVAGENGVGEALEGLAGAFQIGSCT